MAKIKYSALVSNMTGKLNGSTMQRSRYGHVMHQSVQGRKQVSNKQAALLSYRQEAWYSWSLVNDFTKVEWDNRAAGHAFHDAYGQPYFMTGREMYTRAKTYQLYTHRTTAPSPTVPNVPPTHTASLNSISTNPAIISFDVNMNGSSQWGWVLWLAVVPRKTSTTTHVDWLYAAMNGPGHHNFNYVASQHPSLPVPTPGTTWYWKLELWDMSAWLPLTSMKGFAQ